MCIRDRSTILNKKMFIVLSTLPDRLINLLNITKLKDRIVNKVNDINKILDSTIDWDYVNKSINDQRIVSINWLEKSLESIKK